MKPYGKSTFQPPSPEKMTLTNGLQVPFCSHHHTQMEWGETDFTYEEDGIEVTVRHIAAWVCPHGDDVALPPGVTDELITTVRELIKVAKRKNHPMKPHQEYRVRVLA